MSNLPKTIPFGRIPDLRGRPDVDLIALCPGRGVFDDYRVKRYGSRKADAASWLGMANHKALHAAWVQAYRAAALAIQLSRVAEKQAWEGFQSMAGGAADA